VSDNSGGYLMKKRYKRSIFLVGFIITAAIYITWRIFFTIPWKYGLLSAFFGVALVVSEAIAVLEAFSNYRNMSGGKSPEKPEIPDEWYPDVDILIATHSEEPELLEKTINGCLFLKYPDKNKVHIFLCDDTNRPEMRQLVDRLGVGYFGLADNKEAKAGNLNNAIFKTESPLIVTLDSDMIPMSGFLVETVPYFFLPKMVKKNGKWLFRAEDEINENEKVGFIQTPQSFYNADMFQFNLYADRNVPNEQDYFFREVNIGRNRTNSAVYAGSNTVISRQALEEVGGIRTGTITEDFATGIDIQGAGYITYAIDKVLAHGLAPKDFKSLIKQRQRWARGCVQVLRSFKFIFGPLPVGTKISYFICFLYWWSFFRRGIYILSPILFSVFGIVIVDCSIWELLIIWLPSYIIYNKALRVISGNIRNTRWSNIIDTILFPYLIIPVIAETFGMHMKKFAVTPKTNTTAKNSAIKYAIPHIILAVFSAIGIIISVYHLFAGKSLGTVIIIYWLVFNLYMLINSIIFAAGRINYRNDERFYAQVSVTIHVNSFEWKGKTADISENGMAVLLEKPEYLSYQEGFDVQLEYKEYNAHVTAKTLHVQQAGRYWKYSLKIINIDDENRRQYLQIVFDRDHTLPITIGSGLPKDISSILNGLTRKRVYSNRKLPRIPMNVSLSTADGHEVEIVNFNYEYVLLKKASFLGKEVTILLDGSEAITCIRAGERKNDDSALYMIYNWREISNRPRFREALYQLISNSLDVRKGC